MLRKLLLVLTMVVCVATVCDSAKPRTVDSAKKEKKSAQRKIDETNRKLSDNKKRTRQNLNQLNMLRGEIMTTDREIVRVQASIDSIDAGIRVVSDSLVTLNAHLDNLTDVYVKALRRLQGSQMATNEIGFVFSSESFAKASARIRYVKEFSGWRKRKMAEIREAKSAVEMQQQHLANLQSERVASLSTLDANRQTLKNKQTEADRMADELARDRAQLKQALEAEKKRLRKINDEITQMVNAEKKEQQKKKRGQSSASSKKKRGQNRQEARSSQGSMAQQVRNDDPDAALTKRFADNKGRMTFPVASPYTIVAKYGKVVEPRTGLQTNNTGIEIVLRGSNSARCAFDGTVSRIYQTREGPYAIMVRHGSYITVYYNMAAPSVKAGQKVSAGQSLGTVAGDERYDGKPMLHFEVRNGSTTYDPLLWVRQ